MLLSLCCIANYLKIALKFTHRRAVVLPLYRAISRRRISCADE
ncbi:hypothetical protein CAMGR0001_0839 [Campylobacter gracilis RM3268]|uniref:Uncharacterized protein n=1 Tax=Campylobacter gracilis RM3268 TaxID=553220 RepID=C8PG46_9BACT|nr:hypothetical protein CAMGR0001_0839 [Campylobacter gracilis RM3268]